MTVPLVPTTWNPSDKSDSITLDSKNITWTRALITEGIVRSIASNSAGKWYFEAWLHTNLTDTNVVAFGIATSAAVNYPGRETTSYGIRFVGSNSGADTAVSFGNNDSWTAFTTLSGYRSGIVMVALDLDAGNLWFGCNGTWYNSGDPATGTNPTYTGISGTFFAAGGLNATMSGGRGIAFFGQADFFYSAPSGFSGPATTWNSGDKSAGATLSVNALTVTNTSAPYAWHGVRSVLGISSGKYYWENIASIHALASQSRFLIGASKAAANYSCGEDANGWGYHGANGAANSGNKYNSNSLQAYGDAYANTNDIVGVALDMDNGKIWMSLNGTWQASGDPAAGTNAAYTSLSGTLYPHVSIYQTAAYIWTNFGSGYGFGYATPTGFNAGFWSPLLVRRSCPIWL